MNKSINGWEVIESYGDKRLAIKVVPGTKVKLRMHKEVLPLFLALTAEYHKRVAKLRPAETGAFNPRKSTLSPTKWSDHSSGTAVDINWNHEGALGPSKYGGMQRMSKAQIAECAAIKKQFKVVIWGGDKARGGDYADPNYWDPMHFAIKPGVTVEKVREVILKLGIDKNGIMIGADTKKPSIVDKLLATEAKGQRPAVTNAPAKKTVAKKAPAKKAPAKKAPAKKAPAKKSVKKVTPAKKAK